MFHNFHTHPHPEQQKKQQQQQQQQLQQEDWTEDEYEDIPSAPPAAQRASRRSITTISIFSRGKKDKVATEKEKIKEAKRPSSKPEANETQNNSQPSKSKESSSVARRKSITSLKENQNAVESVAVVGQGQKKQPQATTQKIKHLKPLIEAHEYEEMDANPKKPPPVNQETGAKTSKTTPPLNERETRIDDVYDELDDSPTDPPESPEMTEEQYEEQYSDAYVDFYTENTQLNIQEPRIATPVAPKESLAPIIYHHDYEEMDYLPKSFNSNCTNRHASVRIKTPNKESLSSHQEQVPANKSPSSVDRKGTSLAPANANPHEYEDLDNYKKSSSLDYRQSVVRKEESTANQLAVEGSRAPIASPGNRDLSRLQKAKGSPSQELDEYEEMDQNLRRNLQAAVDVYEEINENLTSKQLTVVGQKKPP